MSNPYSELIKAFIDICEYGFRCNENDCPIYEACRKIGGDSGPCDWTEDTIKDFLGVKKNETSAE